MKNILLGVCLLALSSMILIAQNIAHPRMLHTTPSSAPHVAPQETSEALTKIYTNLGSPKTNLYDDGGGVALQGPTGTGGEISLGMPFTPKSDCHVSQVQVAATYFGTGAHQVNLNIYEDSGGVPGNLLAGPVTVKDLGNYGACCTLAVANFSPLALSGGTRYWVVANTPTTGDGSDFQGAWNVVVQGTAPPFAVGGSNSSWFDEASKSDLAGEVLGTIP